MDDLRREVAGEVTDQLRNLERQVADLQALAIGKKTDINVAAPAISVAAPSVSVAAAEIDLSQLEKTMASLDTSIKALTAMLAKTVTRTVHRDSDRLIDTITEKRT
jgi:uncharacterized protein with PhoU and TrkA domain